MQRSLCLGILLAVAAAFASFETAASGSVGPGSILNERGAYALGKALTFRELVCRTCPIQRLELNHNRARSLLASLAAAFEDIKPGTPDDDNIKALCSGTDENCAVKVELVHYYLQRRYRL